MGLEGPREGGTAFFCCNFGYEIPESMVRDPEEQCDDTQRAEKM